MLKRFCLIIAFVSVIITVYGQRYIIIETGRPQAFEYNNARNIIGKSWGITFGYFEFDGVDFEALDSINALNKIQEDRLALQKGTAWREAFQNEVKGELEKNEVFRAIIRKQRKAGLTEEMIHLEKRKLCRNHYKAYVFKQVETAGQQYFHTISTYRINSKRNRIKLTSLKSRPIHFSYPENGIR